MENTINKELLASFFKKLAEYGNHLCYEKNIDAYYNYDIYTEKFNVSWEIGRDTGGSCFGGEAQYEATKHKEPEFEALEFILLELDPNFSLRNYKEVLTMVGHGDYRTSEYYGNGVYYNEKYFYAQHLITKLENLGMVICDEIFSSLENTINNELNKNKEKLKWK